MADGLEEAVGVIKSAGPAAGGLAIAFYGVWGGQYAKKFKAPVDDFASWACFAAIVIGLIIAIWRSARPLKHQSP